MNFKQIATKILVNKGYSKEDAKYLVEGIYNLNEGFDGEQVDPTWLAGRAMECTVEKMTNILKEHGYE